MKLWKWETTKTEVDGGITRTTQHLTIIPMETISKAVKKNWEYWLKSAIQTLLSVPLMVVFLGAFFPQLNIDLSAISVDDIKFLFESGALLALIRTALVKALWAGIVAGIGWLAFRFSAKK